MAAAIGLLVMLGAFVVILGVLLCRELGENIRLISENVRLQDEIGRLKAEAEDVVSTVTVSNVPTVTASTFVVSRDAP